MNKNSLEHAENRLNALEKTLQFLQDLSEINIKIQENQQIMIELLIKQCNILDKRLKFLEQSD